MVRSWHLRVCMITEDFPPVCAGVGHYVHALANELMRRGHELTVITRGSWRSTTRTNYGNLTVYHVRFFPLYPFHVQPHGIFVNQLLGRLQNNLDIIHIHGPMAPSINTVLPTVLTQHGTARASIGYLRTLDFFSVGAKAFSWMYEALDRAAVKSVNCVSAVSEACADELIKHCNAKDVQIIGNGVDTEFFTPIGESVVRRKQPIVAYVGLLNSRKGLPDLVNGMSKVIRDIPEAHLVLAGAGPMEVYLRRQVRELGLQDCVSFVGYLDREGVRTLYREADVMVLPSYHEGLPNVVLESMASGTPIVATRIPGTIEAVEHGQVGLLVEPHEPEQISQAIMKLLGDDALRREMSIEARRRAQNEFDWRVVADRVECIYEGLVH